MRRWSRRPLPDSRRLDYVLTVRFVEADWVRLLAAAKENGMRQAEYARRALMRAVGYQEARKR